jgi:hypothetical protein
MSAPTTAILKADASPSRGGALIVADALDQEAQQRSLLGQYVAKHMTDGTDYGVIPGTKNKTLLKPGAEKLTQLFRCIPRYVVEDKIEDWATGHFHYRFSCQIVTQADGTVVAEGVGSCSTFESRYRWRNGERSCPNCGKAAIIKGKAEYGGGWLCFGKKGGCGAKFSDGDQSIEGQSVGRVQNPDIHDCVNTVLKMAKKRALVDAAISLARCSDIFTQDVEDMLHHEPPPVVAPSPPQPDMATELARESIANARTLPELAAVWSAIPADIKPRVLADKDKRKAELAALTKPDTSGKPSGLFPQAADSLPPAH